MRKHWSNLYLLMIVNALVWGSTPTVVTYLYGQGLRAQEILLGRLLFSFVALAAGTALIPESRRALANYRPKHLPAIIICGALAVFLYAFLYFLAIGTDVKSAPSFVIINYLWPLMTMLFGVLILKEKLTWHIVAGCLVGFAGFLVIQISKMGDGGPLFGAPALGCALAFGAALCWALFGALGRRFSDHYHFEPLSSMFLFTVAGIAMAVPVYLVWGVSARMFARWDVVALMLLLGGGAEGMCNIFWLRIIKLSSAGRASLLAYLTPVFSLVFLGIFMHLWPAPYSLVGIVLILGAIVFVELRRRWRLRAAAQVA